MRAYLYGFLLAGMRVALWAQWPMRSAYRRGAGQAGATRPLTGAGAAREAGHALQHQELYWPMQARLSLLPFTRLGARRALPLLVAGLVLRGPPG